MAISEFTLAIKGDTAMLMHSARLSDPLDEATKAVARVSAKQKKTTDDHEERSRLEHRGSLYFDAELGPYIPGMNIEACLYEAAKKLRKGKDLKAALLIPEEVNPLAYDGPRDMDGLWEDKAFVHRASVKVTTSRIIRTRPAFHNWAVTAKGSLDTESVDQEQFERIVSIAGQLIGLGDWRPRFGRFHGEVTFE